MAELNKDDLNEMLKALASAPEELVPEFQRGMTQAILLIHGPLRQYPAATEGNSPNQRRWYQRGYGIRWRDQQGNIKGARTSERLGASWSYKVNIFPNGIPGFVKGPVVEATEGNRSSYVELVQGGDQTDFHRRHGWPTVEKTVDEARPGIYKLFNTITSQWIEKFERGQ